MFKWCKRVNVNCCRTFWSKPRRCYSTVCRMQVWDRSHSRETEEAGERPEHQRAGAERARAPSEDVGAKAHRAVQQPGELLVFRSPPRFHLHPSASRRQQQVSSGHSADDSFSTRKCTEGGGRPTSFDVLRQVEWKGVCGEMEVKKEKKIEMERKNDGLECYLLQCTS